MRQRVSLLYGTGAALCLGMLGYGLYAQYIQHFEPCPLCYFQRMVIGFLGVAWLINALCRRAATFQLLVQLIVIGIGGALSIRHAWIQMHPEIASNCGMGIQYMLETFPMLDVLLKSWKGTVDCADSSWRILGLTAPVWLSLFFLGSGFASVYAYLQTLKARKMFSADDGLTP